MKYLFVALGVGLLIIFPFIVFGEENMSDLDCFIEPSVVVNIGSEVAGIIDTLSVDRGDFVDRGQVLVRLDTRVEKANIELLRARAEMKATMESRKARLEFATREHGRKDELFKKGIISLEEIDEAKTNLMISERELQETMEQKQIAELELEQAQAVFDRRIIRSPIKGVVVERLLSEGELVDNQPILKLAQLDPLYVEVIAPVTMLGSVKKGQRAEITPEDPMSDVYHGNVKIVDLVIDAASGTFGIRVELSNPEFTLPAGLKCRARFFIQ